MIAINFASRNYRLIEWIRSGLIAACVILGVIMIALIWTAVSLRVDISALDAKLKELEAVEKQVQPALLERGQLVKDLSAMSGLLESRKFSWTRLLTSIEAVVPVGLALHKVDFNPKDHMLTLEGTAHSPESLRNLIVGLEKSASFKDPFLKHQSLEKGNISFNVVAVYREDTGVAVAQGNR
jgi:Tfp pilus assembly protein PilN